MPFHTLSTTITFCELNLSTGSGSCAKPVNIMWDEEKFVEKIIHNQNGITKLDTLYIECENKLFFRQLIWLKSFYNFEDHQERK
jgi:hypothetical protein